MIEVTKTAVTSPQKDKLIIKAANANNKYNEIPNPIKHYINQNGSKEKKIRGVT